MKKIKRYIENVRYTVYLLSNKLQVAVPRSIARCIARKNIVETKKIFGSSYTDIATYDGSGQTVHPSSITYNGITYLALTPFPYSLDTYENPCIYIKKGRRYHMHVGPVKKPLKGSKNYLNDPCLFEHNGLNLAFRHTFVENGVEIHNILFSVAMNEDGNWTTPKKLIESCGDDLISPAVIEFVGVLHIFCVQHGSDGVWKVSVRIFEDNNKMFRENECIVHGLPDNAHIWHIDVFEISNNLHGLFTVKNKNDKYGLFRTKYNANTNMWIIEKEIKAFTEWSESIDIIYKATIEKDTGDCLVSVRDKRGRWSLLRIPKDGEKTDEL